MSITREEALKQIDIEFIAEANGINIDPKIFASLDFENTSLPQIHSCMDYNLGDIGTWTVPAGFRFKSTGFYTAISWNPRSDLSIEKDNDKFYIVHKAPDGKVEYAEEIVFEAKPKFYNQKTSNGKLMSRIVQVNSQRLSITYSNECCLKEKGWDCKFCNINATKSRLSGHEKLDWKTPQEISEAVEAGYKDGFHGYNLTGGFVPERREVEYYIDVIEAVKSRGIPQEEIHGMACVGAPQDLSIIENYKEAGYQHIATNMELWDENMFKYICPGKEYQCGGRQNWVNTLKHEVEVFGRGNVRSNFVGGLEAKTSLLEGVEALAELGVVPVITVLKPNIGSELEGHRACEWTWYKEVFEKTYQIMKKNNLTYENLYYTRGDGYILSHYFRLDGENLPWEKPLDIK